MTDSINYVRIMVDSLRKKSLLLDKIISRNDAQRQLIKNAKELGDVNWDKFNMTIAEKESVIDQINELDEGFGRLYERVAEELRNHKEKYRDEIHMMQQLISEVTDKGVSITSGEERNRADLERVLMSTKKDIRESKKSVRIASDYYKSMSGLGVASELGFLDTKK